MQVKSLKISSFRNIHSCALKLSESINVFYGKNGSGKTNLLEAIFILLLARSPRRATDSIMLKESAEFYRVEGEVHTNGKSDEIAVAYQIGGRKKITIGQISARASELFENFCAVSTSPDDAELLSGAPARRREFVNIYLSQASQKYIADLSDYQKALAQKNAFLKQQDNTGETPYDDLMVKYGTAVIMARRKFLNAVGRYAVANYEKISGGQRLGISYIPSVAIDGNTGDADVIEQNFRKKLTRFRERERILQTALVGPHRDDVEFLIRDLPARTHGSQGEIRTAAISLKLAVFDYLKEIRKVTPVLLLDEIFAELDAGRQEMLIKQFGRFGQIFLTTASSVPETLAAQARKFRIENGAVIPD
jgi:DNA replication and repair protein RecF